MYARFSPTAESHRRHSFPAKTCARIDSALQGDRLRGALLRRAST
jgi:hypothetical protein